MTCDDVRHGVYVYLDGEFALPEASNFEAHLAECADCRTLVEGEGLFLVQFKAKIEHPPLPAGLRAAVDAQLAAEPLPRVQRLNGHQANLGAGTWGRVASWAAVAALVLGGVWGVGTLSNTEPKELEQAVAVHERDLPMEVQGTREHVRSFLQRNVAFQVKVPYQKQKSMQLRGARLVSVAGKPAVLYSYNLDGRRISVVQTEGGQALGRAPRPTVNDVNGLRVMTVRQNGLNHQVIGNVRARDFRRLVSH